MSEGLYLHTGGNHGKRRTICPMSLSEWMCDIERLRMNIFDYHKHGIIFLVSRPIQVGLPNLIITLAPYQENGNAVTKGFDIVNRRQLQGPWRWRVGVRVGCVLGSGGAINILADENAHCFEKWWIFISYQIALVPRTFACAPRPFPPLYPLTLST